MRGAGTPISSQCPAVVSLPWPSGARRPWTTGRSTGGTPSIGMTLPSPSRPRTGRSKPPTALATCASVFVPASPYSAASGSAPAPQASRTITNARRGPSTGPIPAASGSGARVRLEVDVLQAVAREMRVELSGGDVGVAEHLLDRAEVAAAGEQVRRERVPERVRRHAVGEAGGRRVPADDLVEALAGERLAAEVDEQVRDDPAVHQRRAAAVQVDPHGLHRGAADRHHALLRALAACAQHAELQVHVGDLDADRLGRAQPTGVHQLEQRTIAK